MQAGLNVAERVRTRIAVREATPEDAEICGRVFYDAFESIATRHNLPIEPSSREFTRFKAGEMLAHPGFAGVVAERGDAVLGCAFADERGVIAGIGPVCVDPGAQDGGIGRALTQALLDRERARGAAGVRLVQTAYHYRSLALYTKLGFVIREPLSVLQGSPPTLELTGSSVRDAQEHDIARCGELCVRVHGHHRNEELRDAIAAATARVIERDGHVRGYATGYGYGWHAVAETNDDLMVLLSGAEGFMGLGILVPSRNATLLRCCLEHGLRIVQHSTLMTIGLYNEPSGAYLPSILF